MSYLVLAIILLGLLLIAVRVSDYDLFSPAALFVLVFFFVTILDLFGLSSWNTVHQTLFPLVIIFTGCLAFVVGSKIATIIKPHRDIPEEIERQKNCIHALYKYRIHIWQFIILYVIILGSACLKIREIFKIAGTSDFPEAVSLARYRANAVFASSGNHEAAFSTVVLQCDKFVFVIGFLMVFELLTCIKGRKGWKYSALCVFAFCGSCAYSFLTGGRGDALAFCISFIFVWRILDIRERRDNLKSSLSLIKISIIFLVILLPLFYASGRIVGRKSNGNIFDYISFYFGAGIPSFQYWLQNRSNFNITDNQYPFINTFYGLYQVLSKFGFIGSIPPSGNEWVTLGQYKSNVFTCFYRYYSDFGFLGCIILSLLAGAIYTAIYRFTSRSLAVWTIPFWVNVAKTLVDVGRDESLFSHQLFTLSFWTTAIVMIMISVFLYGIRGMQTYNLDSLMKKFGGVKLFSNTKLLKFWQKENREIDSRAIHSNSANK